MAKHRKICSLEFENGEFSFCLDEILRDDKDNSIEYAFVWRGGTKSPNQFIDKPAYFSWNLLGSLLRKAILEGTISESNYLELMDAILGKPKSGI